jgi:hypothetical protein
MPQNNEIEQIGEGNGKDKEKGTVDEGILRIG